MADPFSTQVILDKKNQKAALSETTDLLAHLLQLEMSRKELIDALIEELDCSKRTIISRLKQIADSAVVIEQNKENYTLCISSLV